MNLKQISLSLLVASPFALSGIAMAQVPDSDSSGELFPPNAQPGHCYARVLLPAIYQDNTEQVLVSEASESIEVIPAQFNHATQSVMIRDKSTRIETVAATFKTISQKIIERPETVKLVPVPATYKEITEQVVLKPASTRIETIPAEYAVETEQVLNKAAHTVWKKGAGFTGSAIQTNVDQGTGEIMCLVEVPATYKTISRRVLVKPGSTQVFEVPARYTSVTRKVVDKPATIEKITVPAIYKTVTRQVIDQPAASRAVEVPAEYRDIRVVRQTSKPNEVRTTIPARYESVTKRTKVTGEKLVWSEVLCDVNITASVISQLQVKLKETGHYHGKLDGILGRGTQRAVKSYAAGNGLPSGTNYIPMETVLALGINI